MENGNTESIQKQSTFPNNSCKKLTALLCVDAGRVSDFGSPDEFFQQHLGSWFSAYSESSQPLYVL